MYRVVVYVMSRTSHVNEFTVNKSASVDNEGEKLVAKKRVSAGQLKSPRHLMNNFAWRRLVNGGTQRVNLD